MEKIKLTPKRKEIIQLMNFNSINDVLRYYPYRYDIYKNDFLSMNLHDKKVSFEGIITSKVKVERITHGRVKTSFVVTNDKQDVKVVMFNKFANKYIYEADKIVVTGKYNSFNNEISVSSFFMGSLEGKVKFNSIYSLPTDLKDHTYRTFVKYMYEQALQLNLLENEIPIDFINKYRLVDLDKAISYIHNPTSEEQLKQAYRHLKYEEFLKFCIIGSLKRKIYSTSSGIKIKKVDVEYVKEFINSLPFKLTSDQKQVCKEIIDDLKASSTMSRLLQGDVGSGKTIVALIALIANFTSSYQGAIMAPTDILARQHYDSINKFLKGYDINVSLLVSDMSSKEKKEVLENISNGKTDIVIGTHALIQDSVKYFNLGLAIIDEQHRFGVKQRVALKEKGKQIDVLYMSATPIPRTLASTIYMDMDVSTIQCYPYSERKINTYYLKDNNIDSEIKFINQYLASKQKIYVVCPSINESSLDISNVIEISNEFKKKFKDYNVGVIHGKMSANEKNEVMDSFVKGEISILVSTTVIEVGINVFDANMMIIYNAERFGLAQIHQLRGRIARDGNEGYCYLLSSSEDIDVSERLSFIASSNDGFKISEYDLKRRGAGDMLGLAQSGKSPFTIANLIDDFNILVAASKDASYIINNESKYKTLINKCYDIIHNVDKYVD